MSRKYNVTEKELYSVLENKIKILENLKNNKKNIENSNSMIKNLTQKYHLIAEKISSARIKKSSILEKKISSELKNLGMKDCLFKIDITTDENLISKNGYDKVSFN